MKENFGRIHIGNFNSGANEFKLNRSNQSLLFNDIYRYAAYCFASLGVRNIFIQIERADNDLIPVAGALGGCFHDPWYNTGRTTLCKIYINLNIMAQLNDSEICFVIAHECSHIYLNHSIATFLGNLPTSFSKLLDTLTIPAANRAYVDFLKIAISLSNVLNLHNNMDLIKKQELEADRMAISITNDINGAKSCLLKICNGDHNCISHFFEVGSKRFPIMTVEQRIKSW